MKIILVGYRASGKTTLGRLLAERLQWPLLDVDLGIEQRVSLSIADYYRQMGEEHYRELESRVVAEMCAHDECVIAFGAGTLTHAENQRLAQINSTVLFLSVPPEELWRRMPADPRTVSTRPNLRNGDFNEVVELLEERTNTYRAVADFEIDGTQSPERLVDVVLELLQQSHDVEKQQEQCRIDDAGMRQQPHSRGSVPTR